MRFKHFISEARVDRPCTGCGESSTIQDKTKNLAGEPVYKCRLCDHEMPRKVYDTKKGQARKEKQKEWSALVDELLNKK